MPLIPSVDQINLQKDLKKLLQTIQQRREENEKKAKDNPVKLELNKIISNYDKEILELYKQRGKLGKNDNEEKERITKDIETMEAARRPHEAKLLKLNQDYSKSVKEGKDLNPLFKETTELLGKVLKAGQQLPSLFNLENINIILQFSPTTVNKWMEITGVLDHLVHNKSPGSLQWENFYNQLLIDLIENKDSDQVEEEKISILGKIESFKFGVQILPAINSVNRILAYYDKKNKEININSNSENVDTKHLEELKKYDRRCKELSVVLKQYISVIGKLKLQETIENETSVQKRMDVLSNEPYWDPDKKTEQINFEELDKIDNLYALFGEKAKLEQIKSELETNINKAIDTLSRMIDNDVEDKDSNLYSHHFFRKKPIGADSTPIQFLKEMKNALESLKNSFSADIQKDLPRSNSNRNF